MLACMDALCYTLSMQPEVLLFKEAMEAVQKRDIPLARELLTRLLQRDRSNADYWVWMSAVVETVKEREFCLREAYKLDPSHPTAIRGLRLMGENIKDPNPIPPLDPCKLQWKTSLELAEEQEVIPVKPRTKASSWITLGLIVVGLGSGIYFLTRGPRYRPDTSPILKFSLTPPVTATLETTPLPVGAGPAPLWTLLEATYTSTPIYAATPHKLTEAYQAAMRAYERQNWPLALEFFQQVLYSEPASPDIQYHIGEIYRFQSLAEESAAAFEASLKISPTFAPAYVGRGRAYLMATPPQTAKARTDFEKALQLDPFQYEAYYELARLELAAGNDGGALEYLDQLPPGAPDSVQQELTRAEAYLLQGEPKPALEAALAANRIDITNLPVYEVLAKAYLLNNQAAESIPPLETYLTWVKDDPDALGLMATALVSEGEYAKALDYANKALEIDNASITALLARGEIYLHDGQVDEAARDFNAVLRENKKSFPANLGISRIQLSRELYGSAYEYARAAYELAQGDRELAAALYWRAQALIGLDEKRAAARDLEALLNLPDEALTDDLRLDALSIYKQVITATPTLTPSVTPSPQPTKDLPALVTATPRN